MQPKLMATQKDVAELMEQILIDKKDADLTLAEVDLQQKEAAVTAAEYVKHKDLIPI